MRHPSHPTRPARAARWLPIAIVLSIVTACGSSGSGSGATATSPRSSSKGDVLSTMGKDVLASTADVASSLYQAALADARTVKTAVHVFLDQPTQANLDAARQAWLAARPAYLHTEGLRFASGPIDTGDNPEGFINAWPLDENYVDSIIAGPETITPETLRAANERGGEKNISTGWHAVEYLLWGEDTDPVGPGNRPASDYTASDPGTARRREYLGVVTDMLIDDLGGVTAQWDTGGAYRAEFEALSPIEGVRRTLTGIGTLSGGELYAQRMTVPYDTKDHEEEHSCFSDNTTVDHQGDVASIRHLYLGERADGTPRSPALTDLAKAVDPALDQRMRAALDAARDTTAAIPRPFDQAILGTDDSPGRTAIRAALAAVNDQTQAIIALATALGLQIGTEVP